MTTTKTWHTTVSSALLGELTLVRDEEAFRGLYFPHHWYLPDRATLGPRVADGFDAAVKQLDEYLAGERISFDLELAAHGDGFQRQVWRLVSQIPYASTTTYGELASKLGGGGVTAQEVGAAVGCNPLSIFIPCHRVVGKNNKLTGYAGGLARKRGLLDLEQATLTPLHEPVMSGLW